jgi:hypothetical protein
MLHCKKRLAISRPRSGSHKSNSPWQLFPAKESWVSDILAGDGKIANILIQCILNISRSSLYTNCFWKPRANALSCLMQEISLPIASNVCTQATLYFKHCKTVIFFLTITVVLNLAFAPSWVYMGHLLRLKYERETLECAYLSFNTCPP